ncbi:hypothetical protein CJF32_00010829 [Rutstroemia sp. NJR-2017a WRK4]|nr:hypothetical protein CJF32_00010829 [Rutstroemia sp. NJR-2017a WRK4]
MARDPQVPLHEISDADVEDIPRPAAQQHVLQFPASLVNVTPWRHFAAIIFLASIDMALNVSAGAAAANVGAKLNHKAVTSQVLRIGAQAGAIKSAITTFREIVLMAKINFVFRMLMLLTFSSFGICLVLTAQVSNQVLGETPKELLIAALVASIPLFFESIRDLEPKPEENGGNESVDLGPYSRPIISVCLIGADALGGYVFARMASNQGIPISNYRAACSAGAVFGTLTFLARAITGIIVSIQLTRSDHITTIFGRFELITPEPIILSEEEYQTMERTKRRMMAKFLKRLEYGTQFFPRLAARLLCCVPMNREKKRELQSELRNGSSRREGGVVNDFRSLAIMAGLQSDESLSNSS